MGLGIRHDVDMMIISIRKLRLRIEDLHAPTHHNSVDPCII